VALYLMDQLLLAVDHLPPVCRQSVIDKVVDDDVVPGSDERLSQGRIMLKIFD